MSIQPLLERTARHAAAFVDSLDTRRIQPATGLAELRAALEGDARDQKSWNPEWSRRGRGFAVYAAIRSLGRRGIAEIVDRCCGCARRLVAEIGGLPGVEVLAEPVLNQGLVRFVDPAGDHDGRTDDLIRRIQADGVAWFGPTTWRGQRAMRISVVNWRTSDGDVDRTVASVRAVLEQDQSS